MNNQYNKLYDSFIKEHNHSIKRTILEKRIKTYIKQRDDIKRKFIEECLDEGWYIKKCINTHPYSIKVYDDDHEINIIEK